jgi:hypothetical protein
MGQFLPIDEAKNAQMGMDTHPVGRVGYGIIGEEYLRGPSFGENVVRLVGSRVVAKR